MMPLYKTLKTSNIMSDRKQIHGFLCPRMRVERELTGKETRRLFQGDGNIRFWWQFHECINLPHVHLK